MLITEGQFDYGENPTILVLNINEKSILAFSSEFFRQNECGLVCR